ncbi:hypothetical protein J6590_011837, partial [Homalodisca vitripennis]
EMACLIQSLGTTASNLLSSSSESCPCILYHVSIHNLNTRHIQYLDSELSMQKNLEELMNRYEKCLNNNYVES